MAITTDTTIDVQIAGVTVDTIGLSDTLDNYSIDDIISSGYCSLNHGLWLCGYAYTYQDQKIMTSNIPVTLDSAGFPIECSAGDPQGYNYPDGKYCAIVWLYSTNATFDYAITDINCDNYRMVTEWNAPRYVYYPASPSTNGVLNTYRYGNWTDNEIPYGVWSTTNDNSFQHCYYWSDDSGTDKVEVQYIKPYLAFVNENDVPFLLSFDYGYSYACGMYGDTSAYAYNSANISFDRSENVAYTVAIDSLGNTNLAPPNADTMPFTMNSYGRYGQGWTADGKFAAQIVFGSSSIAGHSGYLSFETYFMLHSKDDIFRFIANTGLKFYTDKLYKPIISGGHVTGYTDDMDEESELDDWDGTANHGAGPYPPVPPVDDDADNTDPISTAGAPYAKGLVNYYAMTAGSVLIDHISEALSTWDLQNTGKDLFKNLVSCKLIKPPAAIPTTGSEPFTIYGEKPQYQGADITLPVVSGNPDATFGPYSISRKFNDFRDYAPYTRVCIYLPYCGWCDLPSHVVGRSVTVKYFTDIIAATVRAVVFCGNNIVAEAAGVMGLDIPFTADAVGMKQAGVISGLTAYAGGALQTAAGVASIVTTKGGKGIGETLSGASKLVSAYTQTAIAFNENTTEIAGKNGDGCSLSGATNIIIKIIRPKYGASSDPPYVPAGFAHSVGFVSNKQVRVGNVSGLLIADNVDTSGIAGATDAERAEIKRVLETGLIVNAAPE